MAKIIDRHGFQFREEEARAYTSGVVIEIGKCWLIGGMLLLLFGFVAEFSANRGWTNFHPVDATDQSRAVRSGMKLRTDYGTGCQYLETDDGVLVPRMGKDHLQVCS